MVVNDAVMVAWGDGWELARVTHVGHNGDVFFVYLYGAYRVMDDSSRKAHRVGRYVKGFWGWRFVDDEMHIRGNKIITQ